MPTPPKRGPLVILIMLILMLGLSIGAIALIVYFNSNRPTAEELTAACQDKVGAAITAEYGQVIDACKAEASETKTFPAVNGMVGFDYPKTWEVAVPHKSSVSTDPLSIYVSNASINLNIVTPIPVIMQISAKDTKAPTLKDYVTALYTENTSAKITEASIGNQNVVVVDFVVAPGAPASGTYEDIYFAGSTTLAKVEYVVEDGEKNADEFAKGWQTIKNSLDFSSIQ